MTTVVQGNTAPGFESVRETFSTHAGLLGRGGGAFSAHFEGECIVNLWAGKMDHITPWSPRTLQLMHSTNKGAMTVCLQLLMDRGLLKLEKPVAHYWPEFARHGKKQVTVRQVLNQTAGVVVLPGYRSLLTASGEGWDDTEAIARALATAEPAWSPGTRHGYHAYTYYFLIGEILARITGASIGDFFRAEVARPMGLDMWLGVPASEHERVVVEQGLRNPVIADFPQETLNAMARTMAEITGDRAEPFVHEALLLGLPDMERDDQSAFWANRNPVGLTLDTLTGAATIEAQSRLYALLACGGVYGSRRLLSESTVAQFAQEEAAGKDAILRLPWRWGLGYILQSPSSVVGMPPAFGPCQQSFGFVGGGGQLAFADPVNRISAAFGRNHTEAHPDMTSALGSLLVESLYRACGHDTSPELMNGKHP